MASMGRFKLCGALKADGGDIIIAVNRERVEDMAKFNKLAGVKDGQLLMHVQRGNGALFIIVR